MQIANPIYDVVFKYLMEDAKVAKLMISSIIGEEIENLSFLPQEFIAEIEKSAEEAKISKRKQIRMDPLTVYRLDFSANIKTADGYKKVIIELQKAKFPADIMRFRKYLGEQFSNKDNFQKVKVGSRFRKTGLPIISIYFLGHKLDYTKSSAIKVSRQYIDLMTNKIIETKESFIESLTLDSFVIQIPYLTDKRRNDLEILLSVFDQRNNVDKDHHVLNVKESEFPEKYRPIIRKLQKAVEDNEVRKKMNMEDGIIDELEDLERTIDDLEQENEIVKQENEIVKQENEIVKQENEIVKQENNLVKQRLGTVEQEKEALMAEIENLRKSLNNKK
ncbi:MAG: hypothetical protein WCP85_17075 [Mariniphaga sp.]